MTRLTWGPIRAIELTFLLIGRTLLRFSRRTICSCSIWCSSSRVSGVRSVAR